MKTILETLAGFNGISVAFRILLSALMGGCVGFERGQHGQAAGLRTHILVCLGSTLTVLVGLYTVQVLHYSSDPLRIGAQVISGIGFLGAGAIMTKGLSQVSGLTTAAGLWTTAGIGLAVGVGFYWAAAITFICAMIAVGFLSHSSRLQRAKPNYASYYIELDGIHSVEGFLDQLSLHHFKIQLCAARSGIPEHIGLELTIEEGGETIDLFLKTVRTIDCVKLAIPTAR